MEYWVLDGSLATICSVYSICLNLFIILGLLVINTNLIRISNDLSINWLTNLINNYCQIINIF
mgnify:CR=1 FL=1